MNNDRYKYLTIASLFILLVGVIVLRIAWLLPLIGLISGYTYCKRRLVIPRQELWKAQSQPSPTVLLLFLCSATPTSWYRSEAYRSWQISSTKKG